MSSIGVIWLIIIVVALIRKANEQDQNKRRTQGGQVQTKTVPQPRPMQQQRAQQQAQRTKTVPRTVGDLSGNKSAVNRSLAGMNDGDVEQPSKIEQRRKQQQATADKSRIHQELHKKEEVEEKQKELARQAEMSKGPQRFEFEDSDLMAEVQDLIVCGYPTELRNQRDFLAEGMDFLNRISSSEA